MRYTVILVCAAVALTIGWWAGTGDARQSVQRMSNLPTEIRPERERDPRYTIAFGPYESMEVKILRIDPNGRWVEVEFAAGRNTADELPDEAWIHIEQITMIAR